MITSYGLNNDGSFSNLDSGEFYHKGGSVQTINGTRITSNLNTTESVKKSASDIAAPFFELPQYIGTPIINQFNKGVLNGETVFHQTYELNNWRIEHGRSATSVGRPTFEEGKEIINNTISVTPLGIETKLEPVIDYIVEDVMIKQIVTEIIERL